MEKLEVKGWNFYERRKRVEHDCKKTNESRQTSRFENGGTFERQVVGGRTKRSTIKGGVLEAWEHPSVGVIAQSFSVNEAAATSEGDVASQPVRSGFNR